MNKFILVIFATYLSINMAFAQDEAAILKSFKNKVDHLDSLFSATPVVMASQNWNELSTGKINYLVKIEKIGIKYDLQKTNSLVSPYIGYVTLSIKVSDNQQSGEIEGYKEKIGFADPEKAKQILIFNPCCSPGDNEDEWCKGDIKATFSYQEGIWVFKSIDTEGPERIRNGTSRGDLERGILNHLFE